jgi:hypothetical protein
VGRIYIPMLYMEFRGGIFCERSQLDWCGSDFFGEIYEILR